MIEKQVPGAEVVGEKGRATSFEVTIADKVCYSKLSSEAFPVFEDVVKAVEASLRGETHEIQVGKSSACNIL